MKNTWATEEQKRDVVTLAQMLFQWCPKFRKYADANYVEAMKHGEAQRAIREMRAELKKDDCGGGERFGEERKGKKISTEGTEGDGRGGREREKKISTERAEKGGGRGIKIPEATPEMRGAFSGKMRELLLLPCLAETKDDH